ncbi:MAG TPA: hypothetical protein VNY05_32940 [Candidatus Acidoferrales bacterium]|jgi:hypothetical protein|nr:hypothetical protein [Candidatus Acidoferrales bacterium]
MRALPTLAVLGLFLLSLARADVRNCVCDPSIPETMTCRECSICRDAEGMPTRARNGLHEGHQSE